MVHHRIGYACLGIWFSSCSSGHDAGPTQPPGPGERVVWEGETGPTPYATPAFDASAAYFLGTHNQVYAVNKSNGGRTWTTALPSPLPETFGMQLVAGSGIVAVADYDVFGLNATTGAQIWHFHPSVGRKPGIFGLAQNENVIYAGSASGNVFAVDIVTGAQIWAATVVTRDTVSVYTPVYQNGTLFVAFTEFNNAPGTDLGGVAALDATTGSVRWLKRLPHFRSVNSSTATTGLAVGGGVVVTDARDGPAYAFDAATGATLWSVPTSDPGPYLGNNQIVSDERPTTSHNETLYVGSTSGYIVAYTKSGQQLWRAIAMLGGVFKMNTDDRYLYAVHVGGQLAAFDLNTGELAWTVKGKNGFGLFLMPPAIDGKRLYFGGLANSYAVRSD